LKRSHTVTSFEPFTLLSALSQVTERIGPSRLAQKAAHNEYKDADREKPVTEDVHQKTVLPRGPGGFPTVKYIGGDAQNRGDCSGRQHRPP
jgi:hypothetical protein